MTIDEAMNFDKAFVTDRINECLSICESQLKYGCDVAGLFEKAFKLGTSWVQNHCSVSGFTEEEISDLQDEFFALRLQRLAQVSNAEIQSEQVSKPAPSAQLSVFRVLGKASKFQSLYALNEQRPSPASIPEWAFWPLLSIGWRPSLTVTKRILSHTRPVGGLA